MNRILHIRKFASPLKLCNAGVLFSFQSYDIVIWSATSMKWIEEKMKLLGVSTHPDYKIAFYLDSLAMITVETQKYGVIEVSEIY